MPILTVQMLAGRTPDQKREIARALTETLSRTASCSKEGVTVVFQDYERHDWASGGTLMADKSGETRK